MSVSTTARRRGSCWRCFTARRCAAPKRPGSTWPTTTPVTGELRVLHGKGKKQRLVPVEDAGARRALDSWLSLRGEHPGALLCPVSRHGRIVTTARGTRYDSQGGRS